MKDVPNREGKFIALTLHVVDFDVGFLLFNNKLEIYRDKASNMRAF